MSIVTPDAHNSEEEKLQARLQQWWTDCSLTLKWKKSILESPDQYNPEPIRKSIERLCNPEYHPTKMDYVNLVLKYGYIFVMPELIEEETPLLHVDAVLQCWDLVCLQTRIAKKFQVNDFIQNIVNRIVPITYAFTMLGDIRATSAIVQSIVEAKVPMSDPGIYAWIDLWTGSWILLLAQYIQAKRNGFGKIENHGLEIHSKTFNNAFFISQVLWFWEVHKLDSTDVRALWSLGIEGSISFVSNECIPNANHHFWSPADPFLRNYRAIHEAFGDLITKDTGFFPYGLEVSGRKNHSLKITGKTRERTLSIMKSTSDWEWFLGSTAPKRIALWPDSSWRNMHGVGNAYAHLVKSLPNWRDRWTTEHILSTKQVDLNAREFRNSVLFRLTPAGGGQ